MGIMSPELPESGMPTARVGLYSSRGDQQHAEPAGYVFDNIVRRWSTGVPVLATAVYNYTNTQGVDDKRHQLRSITGLGKDATYTYDADGNRLTEIKGGVTTTYGAPGVDGYTFENRLKVVSRGGNTIRSYQYQADGWQRRTATEDGVATSFLYDGDDVVAEYDNALTLTAHHVTNGIDKTLWSVRGGNLQTPLAGAQNVLAVANAAGSVTANYRYRAFGERVNVPLNGPNPARTDPSFQGRTFDSGLGIYDYRNRSFDPATGRFLQRDPVLGGDPLFNPYCFPGNNPVTGSDPMGDVLTASDDAALAYVKSKLEPLGLTVDANKMRNGSYTIHLGNSAAEIAAAQKKVWWWQAEDDLMDAILSMDTDYVVGGSGEITKLQRGYWGRFYDALAGEGYNKNAFGYRTGMRVSGATMGAGETIYGIGEAAVQGYHGIWNDEAAKENKQRLEGMIQLAGEVNDEGLGGRLGRAANERADAILAAEDAGDQIGSGRVAGRTGMEVYMMGRGASRVVTSFKPVGAVSIPLGGGMVQTASGALVYAPAYVVVLPSGIAVNTWGAVAGVSFMAGPGLSGGGGEEPVGPVRRVNPGKGQSPTWKNFQNYKGKTKMSGKGSKRRYYEWDHTHNDIEVYDSSGRHLGTMDPTTGNMIKSAVPGRSIDL